MYIQKLFRNAVDPNDLIGKNIVIEHSLFQNIILNDNETCVKIEKNVHFSSYYTGFTNCSSKNPVAFFINTENHARIERCFFHQLTSESDGSVFNICCSCSTFWLNSMTNCKGVKSSNICKCSKSIVIEGNSNYSYNDVDTCTSLYKEESISVLTEDVIVSHTTSLNGAIIDANKCQKDTTLRRIDCIYNLITQNRYELIYSTGNKGTIYLDSICAFHNEGLTKFCRLSDNNFEVKNCYTDFDTPTCSFKKVEYTTNGLEKILTYSIKTRRIISIIKPFKVALAMLINYHNSL